MIKAIWMSDYDYRHDACYDRPMCGNCETPISSEDGKYICGYCGEEAVVDDKMRQWFKEREGVLTETCTCMVCGKEAMTVYKFKNEYSLEWETGFKSCSNCGSGAII